MRNATAVIKYYTSKVSLKLITHIKSCYRSDQLSNSTEDSLEIEKCVESDHCGSGNDLDIVDKNQHCQSDSTPTKVYNIIIMLM